MKKIYLLLTSFSLILIFYIGFLNYLEPTQVGIARNLSGGLTLQAEAGWYFSPPWVQVARVGTHPMRVCVTSSGRGFNCKLAKFEPKFFKQFVETEGFRYYWWSNRISFNLGYDEEYRGMKDLIRGYAYSATKYPFIVFIDEYEAR